MEIHDGHLDVVLAFQGHFVFFFGLFLLLGAPSERSRPIRFDASAFW